MNNLALASSVSASDCDGEELFEVVLEILEDVGIQEKARSGRSLREHYTAVL